MKERRKAREAAGMRAVGGGGGCSGGDDDDDGESKEDEAALAALGSEMDCAARAAAAALALRQQEGFGAAKELHAAHAETTMALEQDLAEESARGVRRAAARAEARRQARAEELGRSGASPQETREALAVPTYLPYRPTTHSTTTIWLNQPTNLPATCMPACLPRMAGL